MKLSKILFAIAGVVLLTSCGVTRKKSSDKGIELNVMSFNIRYDNPGDGMNNWKYRKDVAAQIVKNEHIDILGTQEVLFNQLEDLSQRLPGYQSIGVGREDGVHKGEHSAVFYKKDRFEAIDSGNFWLSETPDRVSVGWDAALERIATWVVLKEKKTGLKFLFMNTHLDHIGKVARQESVHLIQREINQLGKGMPVVLTGDFNSGPESPVVQTVTDSSAAIRLYDSYTIAATTEGEEKTFHGFKDHFNSRGSDRIDFIFVNDRVSVAHYKSLPKKLDGIFLSDHVPIEASVRLK